ncbi:Hypothetical predicted protein [Pelobates cultripes]|uniref:Transposase n=1 Tax=Pelobates cultripes TaxID=61616 RepID=A0AAD1RSF4_PELCU|nr:Hypothetical predicted protein [Pelobates cultripes]
MSQHRSKKAADAKEKSDFFTARTPQHKPASQQAQDGAESDTDSECIAGMAISKQTLQQMLVELASKMQTTVHTAVADLRKDIADLGNRSNQVEEFTAAHDSMADKVEELESRLEHYENKRMDLEDRSRRNDLRLRGIPEEVRPQELRAYATEFFCSILPDIPTDMLILDRIHRVARPMHLPPSTQ